MSEYDKELQTGTPEYEEAMKKRDVQPHRDPQAERPDRETPREDPAAPERQPE